MEKMKIVGGKHAIIVDDPLLKKKIEEELRKMDEEAGLIFQDGTPK